MTRGVGSANLGRIATSGLPTLAVDCAQRRVDLDHLLKTMVLGDPLTHLERRRGRFDHALLMQQLHGRVVEEGRRQVESDRERPSGDERRNLGETLDVRALILPRCIPQVVERSPVLPAEHIVERGPQAARTLLDEGVLVADRLGHLALEHDAQLVDIDHNPGETSERLLGERGTALPQQVVREKDRKRVVRLMAGEHRDGRKRGASMPAHKQCKLWTTNGLNLHRVGSPKSSLQRPSQRPPQRPSQRPLPHPQPPGCGWPHRAPPGA